MISCWAVCISQGLTVLLYMLVFVDLNVRWTVWFACDIDTEADRTRREISRACVLIASMSSAIGVERESFCNSTSSRNSTVSLTTLERFAVYCWSALTVASVSERQIKQHQTIPGHSDTSLQQLRHFVTPRSRSVTL